MEPLPESWRVDLRPELFEAIELPALESARPLESTFVVERMGLVLANGGRIVVERPRPGLMRHPFSQRAAAAALLEGNREVPLAKARRVEPPLSRNPLLFREIFTGEPLGTAAGADPCSVIARVISALHRVRGVTVGVHAEGGRFVAATSWADAVRQELALARRAITTHGADLGTLEEALFDRLDGLLDGLVEPLDPCLVHGGLTDAHIRWDGAAVTEVLGWEHAGMGDPLADVGAQLHLGGAAARTLIEQLDSEALDEPGLEQRLAVGYHLSTVRTLATMAASLPTMTGEQRAGWVEKLRNLVDRGLSRDAGDIFHGRPVPPVPSPDPDRAILNRVAEIIGGLPLLESQHALPLAAVLAVMELGTGELRPLALDRVRRLLAGFGDRVPGRVPHPGPVEALARLDALEPDGRVRAACAARVVHTLAERLGDGFPEPARAGAEDWLEILRSRVDVPAGATEELVEASVLAWARPDVAESLRPRIARILRDLPDGPEGDRSAAYYGLAAARVAAHAPLLVAGLLGLGFGEDDVKRAVAAGVPQVDWDE